MSEIKGVHPSALKFADLSGMVVSASEVPQADTQVYQQEPSNGLYFRRSGRLITSQQNGSFIKRARTGIETGKLFELNRTGPVTRQKPPIERPNRQNPVFVLNSPSETRFQTISWVDEEGLHQARPYRPDQEQHAISVTSWLGDTVMSSEFLRDPTSVGDAKVRSEAFNDPVLALYVDALRALEAITGARVRVI